MSPVGPSSSALRPYPQPGEAGGRLIRRVIAALRAQGLPLPWSGPLGIAVSGGVDSLALARLLARYGRRVADPGRITWVHVDHGWDARSGARAESLRALAGEWGMRFHGARLVETPADSPGESPEAHARRLRYRELRAWLEETGPESRLLLAHQRDDLAETVLWRLLSAGRVDAGILPSLDGGRMLRPLLGTWRAELERFLLEEGCTPWRDPTNTEGALLRARVRREAMPGLEAVFPRARERLASLAGRFGSAQD